MKVSLFVAAVVLALAQGSLAQDATAELTKLSQYFEEMKTRLAQQLTEIMQNQDLPAQAQTLQAKLEPLTAQIQERLKTITADVEERVKPMTTSIQDQIQPMVQEFQRQLENIFQPLTRQAGELGN